MNRPHTAHISVHHDANYLLFSKVLVFFFSIPILLCISSAIQAAPNDALDEPAPILKTGDSTFEYVLENRADPFVPFITEKAAASKVDMNEIVDPDEPLTGMQLFEPGQLTLVALLKSGNEDLAMVEDFTGKGYVLTQGIKIGKRGVVKDIRSNEVVIEETAVTRAGKKIISEIVMVLKKEKEE